MIENMILHKRGSDVLARFGTNPFGGPMYRMVRADSRRQWSVGEFRPKYPKLGNCYVIEKWCDPEKYGNREAWEDAKDENGISYLGPYPEQGDYEFVLPVWDEHDQPLNEPGEHHLQVIAWMIKKNDGMTRSTRWAEIQAAEDRAKELRMKKLQAMIADARPLRGGDAERKYGEEMEESAKKRAKLGIEFAPALGPTIETGESHV